MVSHIECLIIAGGKGRCKNSTKLELRREFLKRQKTRKRKVNTHPAHIPIIESHNHRGSLV